MSKKITAARVSERRDFLRSAASLAAALAASGCATTGSTQKGQTAMSEGEPKEAEVTPAEDLMQEHGVLERILLLYDESIRRIESHQPLDTGVVAKAAGIVRRFVEDYHEKLEEQFVFPRLQAAQREIDLVAVLLRQHQRGRLLTDEILRSAGAAAGPGLAQALRSFGRMYRPHAAREDTVLFPAFREVMGRAGYRELGEQFEHKEHELFGEGGFRTVVGQVADLERALGIHDLASFTPA
jgi:hemerythrin-like domain-containing protein